MAVLYHRLTTSPATARPLTEKSNLLCISLTGRRDREREFAASVYLLVEILFTNGVGALWGKEEEERRRNGQGMHSSA